MGTSQLNNGLDCNLVQSAIGRCPHNIFTPETAVYLRLCEVASEATLSELHGVAHTLWDKLYTVCATLTILHLYYTVCPPYPHFGTHDTDHRQSTSTHRMHTFTVITKLEPDALTYPAIAAYFQHLRFRTLPLVREQLIRIDEFEGRGGIHISNKRCVGMQYA